MRLGEGDMSGSKGANFLIQILYQHNNTWQGKIVWLDNKKTMNFRSFLELALLMKEALQDQTADGTEVTVRWEAREEVL